MRPSLTGRHANNGALVFTVAVGLVVVIALVAFAPGSGESRAEGSAPPASATATPDDRAAYLGPSAKPPQPVELHSKWVEQTADPAIAVGATATVTVVFRNVGIERWIKGTPSEIHLGVKGDSHAFADAGMAVGWLAPTRPAAQTEGEVLPGGTATFTFGVKGVRRGTFTLALQPVCDGVAWLEDDGVNVIVTVR